MKDKEVEKDQELVEAKQEDDSVFESKREEKPVKIKEVAKKREPRLALDKYFASVRPDVGIYVRAYLQRQYLGIIKTEVEWNKELKSELGEKE